MSGVSSGNFLQRAWRRRSARAMRAENGEVEIGLRRVYIVPSGAGLSFAVMLVLLLTGSINYNLSLGFALTFLLAALGLIDMHLTYRNMAHLHLQYGRSQPVFAGEEAQYEFIIHNRKDLPRYALWISFVTAEQDFVQQSFDLDAHSSCSLNLNLSSRQRGWLHAPKVQLHTRFPLGLLYAWTYWQPAAKVLVYPFPEPDAPPLPLEGSSETGMQGQVGHDDFAGIRNYQAGDPLKHLAWRQIARLPLEDGGQLVAKHFEGGSRAELCLDFAKLPADLDLEAKLSRMARWVLQAEQAGLAYAFRLGQFQLPRAHGLQHQHACLQALALYPELPH